MRKVLFPPIVPTSLPAFNKTTYLRYYFKPSIANTISQIKHLQMIISRVDTNRSILNKNDYPLDIIFKSISDIKEDTGRGFWYVDIPASIFTVSDIPYKVQIRLGEIDITGMSAAQLGTVVKDFDKMSEWSIVTLVMPISIPLFGIQSFDTSIENMVDSTGYVFTGFYEPQDAHKQETLTSYRISLYVGDPSKQETWKLLSTSGDKSVGGMVKPTIQHIFPIELLEEANYIVTMNIKTKNLYSETKTYRIHSAAYPVLDMFNAIRVEPNVEDAEMKIVIRHKQILLEAEPGTQVEYIIDEPGYESYPHIKGTHAKIDGSASTRRGDIFLMTEYGVWLSQFKLFFNNPKESLADLIANPTIELSATTELDNNVGYFTKVKIGLLKINIAYPTEDNLDPEPEWKYRFVIRKEVLTKVNGVETVVLSRNHTIESEEPVNGKQEYYLFVKEDHGSFDVDIQKTYLSSNSKI